MLKTLSTQSTEQKKVVVRVGDYNSKKHGDRAGPVGRHEDDGNEVGDKFDKEVGKKIQKTFKSKKLFKSKKR